MRRSIITLLALVCISGLSSAEVVTVVEFARHGARGPLYDLNPQGSSWLSKWGVEQLTGNGMRMHYHLGKEMVAKYPDIFNDKFNPAMMQTKSTNFNRTISSAFSHFMGLVDQFKGKDLDFPDDDPRLFPSAKITIDPKVGFRTALPNGFEPIPAFSRPNQRVLQVIRDDCPAGKTAALKAKKEVSDFIMSQDKVKDAMADWAKQLYGINDLEARFKQLNVQPVDNSGAEALDKLFFLSDFMIQDAIHNENAPINNIDEGKKNTYRKALMAYSVASLARFNDTVYAANIISDFMQEVQNIISERMASKNPETLKKYFYYSGHDDLMSAILQQMSIITTSCMFEVLTSSQDIPRCEAAPDLASNLIWELHKIAPTEGKTEPEWGIVFRYNFKSFDFCQTGKMVDNDYYVCPIDKFKEKLAQITYPDWQDYCYTGVNAENLQDQEEDKFWQMTTYVLIGVCSLLLIGVILVGVRLQKALKTSAPNEDLDNSATAAVDDSMH